MHVGTHEEASEIGKVTAAFQDGSSRTSAAELNVKVSSQKLIKALLIIMVIVLIIIENWSFSAQAETLIQSHRCHRRRCTDPDSLQQRHRRKEVSTKVEQGYLGLCERWRDDTNMAASISVSA